MNGLTEKKRACLWMIHHYMDLAEKCRDIYPDLADFYLVYDHCMIAVEYWENRLEELCIP